MLICVILAGGRGTRLIPLTDTTPKPLLKAGGKTLLEWNMDNVVNSVDKFVIVISYLGQQIVDFIGENYKGKPVEYVWQTNPKGGTLDAFRTSIFEGAILEGNNQNQEADYLIIHADDVHGIETFDNLFARIEENPNECYLSAKVLDNPADAKSFGMFEVERKIVETKLTQLEIKIKNENKEIVVDCLIENEKGQILVQKRSKNRRLFPGCWDLIGGHVDDGDTILETISKEIKEETNLELESILQILGQTQWQVPIESRRENEKDKIILQFLVKVENYENLKLETEKATEFRWIGQNEDLEFLKENRTEDFYIHNMVKNHFDQSLENSAKKESQENQKQNEYLEFSEFVFVKIVEKPDYFVSNLANIAISYFPNKVLEFVPKEITNLPIGQKEAYITDLFNDYSSKYSIQVVPTNGMWLPVTSIDDLNKTDQILQNSNL